MCAILLEVTRVVMGSSAPQSASQRLAPTCPQGDVEHVWMSHEQSEK